MTQQSVYVQAGTVTTVHPQLAAGATIYNGDSDNAVWISSSPSVSPDAGMRIGPKGSLQWTTNNAPCYACTDVNTLDAVTLTVSTDIQNLNNPVDIGVAVATQLLAQGVPSVLLSETLWDGPMVEGLGGQNQLFLTDFSRYASVNITLFVSANTAVTVTWLSSSDATGVVLASTTYQITSAAAGRQLRISQLVRGSALRIAFSNTFFALNPTATISGTNRTQSNAVSQATPSYKYSITRSWVNGTIFNLTEPYISNGGMTDIQLQWQTPGVGYVGYDYVDAGGVQQTTLLATTAMGVSDGAGNTVYHGQYSLPPGMIQPIIYATASGSYAITLLMGPAVF